MSDTERSVSSWEYGDEMGYDGMRGDESPSLSDTSVGSVPVGPEWSDNYDYSDIERFGTYNELSQSSNSTFDSAQISYSYPNISGPLFHEKTQPLFDNKDEKTYLQALESGTVPVNRYRLIVVGQDGAGKSCLIDSLLDRPFKPTNPSTDGIAIDVAVTAAEGTGTGSSWTAGDDRQYLDKYMAAGYVITQKTPVSDIQTKEKVASVEELQTTNQELETSVKRFKRTPLEFEDSLQSQSETDINFVSTVLDEYIREITKNEKLTEEQKRIVRELLDSTEELDKLQNCEVDVKLLWDLGGQERYLTTHAALMPAKSFYTVCTYLLAIDVSKHLGDKADSLFRSQESENGQPLDLVSVEYNRDFLRHWLTSIGIAHSHSNISSPYLGESLGVKYPAVLIAGTHMDLVQGNPNAKAFLAAQNEELHKIIYDLNCHDHIVRPAHNYVSEWFYPVDNTKSGQESQPRCEGVAAIRNTLNSSCKAYWSEKNKTHSMPVAWLRFEILLSSWKMGKIISLSTAITLAARCKIASRSEALVALKLLHGLGIIFYFWDNPKSGLSERIFVDPQWLIGAVAAVVTAKQPTKPKYQRSWNKLCYSGAFSMELTFDRLGEAGVDGKDRGDVIEVMKMLDIICDAPAQFGSHSVMIPCMVTRKLTETSVWERYDPTGPIPPPIVIFPEEFQAIPVALFFRLVTRCAREYSKSFELSRDRCTFDLGSSLILELFYYNRGDCLIVSLNVESSEDFQEAITFAAERAQKIQEFIMSNIESAKQRGMSGLKLAYYYQVVKCTCESENKEGSRLPLSPKSFVRHSDDCKPGIKNPVMKYKEGGNVPKEHRDLVHLWFQRLPAEKVVKERRDNDRIVAGATEVSEGFADIFERRPESNELGLLSGKISSVWKHLARQLKVPEDVICQIKKNDQDDVREQAFQMLDWWRKNNAGSATVSCLCRALLKENRRETATDVFDIPDRVLDRLSVE